MKEFSFALILLLLTKLLMSLQGFNTFSACKAGNGEDVTLRLEPQHHGIPTYSSTNYRDIAYIKFKATDFPGPSPSEYDMIVAGNAGENFVNVPGQKCGQHNLFIAGFDASADWNIREAGELPLNVTATAGTQNFDMPVNE